MNRTIVLVDDNHAFRQSTTWLLGGLGYDVREFESAAALLSELASMQACLGPACVLLDVRMPGIDGLQLHDGLLARGADWPVVYITGHGDVPLAVAAMRKGAFSFLEKPFRDSALEQTLAQAFEQVCTNRPAPGAAGPREAVPMLPPPTGAAPADARAAQTMTGVRLTARERQVLDLVVQGKLNKTIADLLGISIKTVELHRSNMMHKLGVRSITELMHRVLGARELRG